MQTCLNLILWDTEFMIDTRKWLLQPLLSLCLWASPQFAIAQDDAARLRQLLGPYTKPLEAPATTDLSTEQVKLGRMLFFDRRISADARVSCNDCHELASYGTNGAHALTLRERGVLLRDVPTVYNKSSLRLFDWDGRHKTLTAKTEAALHSKHELNAGTAVELEARLRNIQGYVPLFATAFAGQPQPITAENVVTALVDFQQGLATPAPIDRFLSGDDDALSADQLKGGFLFDKYSCGACHTGTQFGGQMLQKLGAVRPWPNQKDLGYFGVSKNPDHKMIFRAAPLRNVLETPPYFHDGSSRRLWHAIRRMAEFELGTTISVEDVLSIQAFLGALTGPLPDAYITPPK
ncbi:MAG: cytochrome c peroxidase [Rhodothermales bacterium]